MSAVWHSVIAWLDAVPAPWYGISAAAIWAACTTKRERAR